MIVASDGYLESAVVDYVESAIGYDPSQRETVRLGTSVLPILKWY